MRNRNLAFNDNDQYRYDNYPNAICLSISSPNNFLLDSFRTNYPNKQYYLIKLSPNILWELDCLFFPHNAASIEYREQDYTNFQGATAFQNLFADTVTVELRRGIQEYKRTNKPNYLPTSSQAEVLCFEPIHPNYFLEILSQPNQSSPFNRTIIRYFNHKKT